MSAETVNETEVREASGEGAGRRVDAAAVMGIVAAVFLLVAATGNLTTGPRLADDNQICKLQIEFDEGGFWATLVGELRGRWEMRRLVPVYSAVKVVMARVLGVRFVAWSVWVAGLGAATAALLYAAGRLLGYGSAASFALAAVTTVGEQSVLWWRLLHGEGLGMFFLAAGLAAMGLRLRTGRARYEWLFVVMVALSIGSKESFVLMVPAVLVWKVWMTWQYREVTWWEAVKESGVSIVCLGVVGATVGAIVRLVFGTTEFIYAGWSGFEMSGFVAVTGQYLAAANVWLAVALVVMLAVASHGGGGERDARTGWRGSVWCAVACAGVVWLLVTVPQLLLYMKTGMVTVEDEAHYARYLLPCLLGTGLLAAHLLEEIRRSAGGGSALMWCAMLFLSASVFEKGNDAYREGAAFAESSRANDAWFRAIAESTNKDGKIVLAYLNVQDGGYSTQAALRFYYILRECHGRGEVYYFPMPRQPSLEEGRAAAVQADTRHHGKRMRSADTLESGAGVEAVVVMNWAEVAEWDEAVAKVLDRTLRQQTLRWFDRSEFRREEFVPHGHVCYFRRERGS